MRENNSKVLQKQQHTNPGEEYEMVIKDHFDSFQILALKKKIGKEAYKLSENKILFLKNLSKKLKNDFFQNFKIEEEENSLTFIFDYDNKNLEKLTKEYKRKKIDFAEENIFYIVKKMLTLGNVLENNFFYLPEISLRMIKIFAEVSKTREKLNFGIRLFNPFLNEAFFRLYNEKIVSTFEKLPEKYLHNIFIFDALARKKFLDLKKDEEELENLSELDRFISNQSKNSVYQLFFSLLLMVSDFVEEDFKVEENIFYEQIQTAIQNMNFSEKTKKFFAFILLRNNFKDLPTFSELNKKLVFCHSQEGLESEFFQQFKNISSFRFDIDMMKYFHTNQSDSGDSKLNKDQKSTNHLIKNEDIKFKNNHDSEKVEKTLQTPKSENKEEFQSVKNSKNDFIDLKEEEPEDHNKSNKKKEEKINEKNDKNVQNKIEQKLIGKKNNLLDQEESCKPLTGSNKKELKLKIGSIIEFLETRKISQEVVNRIRNEVFEENRKPENTQLSLNEKSRLKNPMLILQNMSLFEKMMENSEKEEELETDLENKKKEKKTALKTPTKNSQRDNSLSDMNISESNSNSRFSEKTISKNSRSFTKNQFISFAPGTDQKDIFPGSLEKKSNASSLKTPHKNDYKFIHSKIEDLTLKIKKCRETIFNDDIEDFDLSEGEFDANLQKDSFFPDKEKEEIQENIFKYKSKDDFQNNLFKYKDKEEIKDNQDKNKDQEENLQSHFVLVKDTEVTAEKLYGKINDNKESESEKESEYLTSERDRDKNNSSKNKEIKKIIFESDLLLKNSEENEKIKSDGKIKQNEQTVDSSKKIYIKQVESERKINQKYPVENNKNFQNIFKAKNETNKISDFQIKNEFLPKNLEDVQKKLFICEELKDNNTVIEDDLENQKVQKNEHFYNSNILRDDLKNEKDKFQNHKSFNNLQKFNLNEKTSQNQSNLDFYKNIDVKEELNPDNLAEKLKSDRNKINIQILPKKGEISKINEVNPSQANYIKKYVIYKKLDGEEIFYENSNFEKSQYFKRNSSQPILNNNLFEKNQNLVQEDLKKTDIINRSVKLDLEKEKKGRNYFQEHQTENYKNYLSKYKIERNFDNLEEANNFGENRNPREFYNSFNYFQTTANNFDNNEFSNDVEKTQRYYQMKNPEFSNDLKKSQRYSDNGNLSTNPKFSNIYYQNSHLDNLVNNKNDEEYDDLGYENKQGHNIKEKNDIYRSRILEENFRNSLNDEIFSPGKKAEILFNESSNRKKNKNFNNIKTSDFLRTSVNYSSLYEKLTHQKINPTPKNISETSLFVEKDKKSTSVSNYDKYIMNKNKLFRENKDLGGMQKSGYFTGLYSSFTKPDLDERVFNRNLFSTRIKDNQKIQKFYEEYDI